MSSERPEDVDEAFARLIAGFHDTPEVTDDDAASQGSGEPRRQPWPAAEDLDESSDHQVARAGAPDDPTDDLVPAGPGTDSLDTPATWEDEGHFVPPDPPSIPRPAPLRLAAWIGALVGPVLLMVTATLGLRLPQLLLGTVIVGFVGGVIYLIATMDDRPHDPYDPGNGAVV